MSKLHWTQTPEGREKMARIRRAWRRKKVKENGSNGAVHTDAPPEVDLQSYRTGYRDGFEDGRRAGAPAPA